MRRRYVLSWALSCSVMAASAAHAQNAQLAGDEQKRIVQAEQTDERSPLPLPAELHQPQEEEYPPVAGPTNLRADPRGKIPEQPKTISEFAQRFYPTFPWALKPATTHLDEENPHMQRKWQPREGACYVLMAMDEQHQEADKLRKRSHRELAWWEMGADVDVRVMRQRDDTVIALDNSRLLLASAMWCSDGSPVVLSVELGVPADVDRTVDVAWGVAVVPNTLPALRYGGNDALTRRLNWAQSMVAPRGEARSAPIVVNMTGPTWMTIHTERPESGCEIMLAVSEPSILDMSLAYEVPEWVAGDFEARDIAVLPVCAAEADEPETQEMIIGVRAGAGRIVLQRFAIH